MLILAKVTTPVAFDQPEVYGECKNPPMSVIATPGLSRVNGDLNWPELCVLACPDRAWDHYGAGPRALPSANMVQAFSLKSLLKPRVNERIEEVCLSLPFLNGRVSLRRI
jgi:hypothetical protein